MSVVLEPPLGRGCFTSYGDWKPDEALATAPRYMRTGGMGRWHRPRSAYRSGFHGLVCVQFWCGPGTRWDERVLTAEQVPEGQPACGTCEGRACGAGQDDWPGDGPDLLFEPRRLKPPVKCPGSRSGRLYEAVNRAGNVLRCLACGELVPGRCSGGAYNPRYGPVNHQPGPGLVAGCPFHGWSSLTVFDGRAVCACRVPAESKGNR